MWLDLVSKYVKETEVAQDRPAPTDATGIIERQKADEAGEDGCTIEAIEQSKTRRFATARRTAQFSSRNASPMIGIRLGALDAPPRISSPKWRHQTEAISRGAGQG